MVERVADRDVLFEADAPGLAAVLDLADTDVTLRDAAGRVVECFVLDVPLFGAVARVDVALFSLAFAGPVLAGLAFAGLVVELVLPCEVFDADVFDLGVLGFEAFDTEALVTEALVTGALATEALATGAVTALDLFAVDAALDAAALDRAVLGGIWAHSLADPLWRRVGSARRELASVGALAGDGRRTIAPKVIVER